MKRKKLLIEDIYDNGIDTLIPNNIPQFIQSTEWWIVFKEYFDELLLQLKGGYAINLPRVKDYSDISKIVTNIGTIIRLHLISHFYEYNGLYETTQLEYNPIWNVDGTIKTEGTRNSESADSSERNVSGSDKKTGSDAISASGSDINTLSGSDKLTLSGNDKLTHSGENELIHGGSESDNSTTTTAETPMDSTVFLDKSRTTTNDVKSSNYTDQTVFNSADTTEYGRKDTTEYGRKDTTEYGRKDTTEYNTTMSTTSKETISDTGINDEKYVEIVTRQGNIGVTMTQQLMQAEREIVNFSWLEYVVNDITPRFTEGVLFTI